MSWHVLLKNRIHGFLSDKRTHAVSTWPFFPHTSTQDQRFRRIFFPCFLSRQEKQIEKRVDINEFDMYMFVKIGIGTMTSTAAASPGSPLSSASAIPSSPFFALFDKIDTTFDYAKQKVMELVEYARHLPDHLRPLAAMFDLDGTLLQHGSHTAPIDSVCAFARWCASTAGLEVYVITARMLTPSQYKSAVQPFFDSQNISPLSVHCLTPKGMQQYSQCKTPEAQCEYLSNWKASVRRKLARQHNLRVVINVGNQWSDLVPNCSTRNPYLNLLQAVGDQTPACMWAVDAMRHEPTAWALKLPAECLPCLPATTAPPTASASAPASAPSPAAATTCLDSSPMHH